MKPVLFSTPALLALTLSLSPASAQTTTSFQEGVSPTGAYAMDATYIRAGSQANNNQDGDPEQEIIVGYAGGAMRGMFEFDISEIPSSDIIDSVSLVLTTRQAGDGAGASIAFHAHSYGFDIDETTATWNAPAALDADATDGGTLGTLLTSVTFNPVPQGTVVTFPDSAAFRTAVSDALAADSILRLMVIMDDDVNKSSNQFARFAADSVGSPTTTYGTIGDRPELIIEHSPSGPDLTAPGISELNPADGTSGGFYVGTDLLLTFDEDVALTGNGSVTIVDTDDGSGDQVINLPNAAVSVVDAVLTIDPPNPLDGGTNYAVQISADAVVDLSTDNGGGPNAFPGILDSTTWNFATDATDSTGPVISSTDPADDATNIPPGTNLVATFDEDLVIGSGNITIVDVTDGTGTQVITVPDPAVSIAGTVLTIDPPADLEGNSIYAVQFDAGVVRNYSDVGNLAVSDTTTWNFTTTDTTVYAGAAGSFNKDTWNDPANWSAGVPTGSLNAIIDNGEYASVSQNYSGVPCPAYTGDLTLNAGATLEIAAGSTDTDLNALSGGTITMNTGSEIAFRRGADSTHANDIVMAGDGEIDLCRSTNAHVRDRTFNGEISGSGRLSIFGESRNNGYFNGNNSSWSGGLRAYNGNSMVFGGAANSLGTGDITIDSGMSLGITAADAMGDSATLSLNGSPGSDNGSARLKLVMNADDTIGALLVDGTAYPAGTYGRPGGPATVDYEVTWMQGDGVLTVSTPGTDTGGTNPSLVSLAPADEALDVFVAASLIATFDESVIAGSGNIIIKNLTDATSFTIAANSTQVSFNFQEVVINPVVNLAPGKNYAIQIEPTAITDIYGNAYAGISDDTTWNFTTVATRELFSEGFEPPTNTDVDGYNQGSRPANWDGHSGTFGADRHGLCDERDAVGDPVGIWTSPDYATNTQVYRFNYTSSPGITTKEGQIGGLLAGATYTFAFDVQQDAAKAAGAPNDGNGYDARMYAFDPGGNRTQTNSGFGGTVLVSEVDTVTADGSFHTVTLTYTPDPASNPGLIGKDVGVMFKDLWNGSNSIDAGVIDNVTVSVAAETIAPGLVSIDDTIGGGPGSVGSQVVYNVSFNDWMDPSTIGTDDFENGSTAGLTIDSVSPTTDPSVFAVSVTPTSTGDLVLQVKAGAVINDGAGNALDTTSAIPDDTTITVEPGSTSAYDNWLAAYNFSGFTSPDLTAGGDPDNDNRSNLLEFAFGTNPTVADAGSLDWDGSTVTPGTPVVLHSFPGGGGVDFKARFIRRADHGNPGSANYAWRFSSDLTDWESSADTPSWYVAPGPALDTFLGADGVTYELLEIPYPFQLDNNKKARFFQVEVTEVAAP